jgi:CRP/FNR family cyclic AMP-dependent transcriptional regulator
MRYAEALMCGNGAWVETAGYLASFLVLATFCMQTMIPLRVSAILSNIVFILYASYDGLYPILILHSVLLPLNITRTMQMIALRRLVQKAAKGDFSIEWLPPFMKRATWKAGETIFKQRDYADCIYMLVSGQVRLEEIDHVLEPGDLFGEIGVFSPAQERTQTARAISDVELLWINQSDLAEVCYKNPGFAFHFLRLSINRLLANAGRPVPAIPRHLQPIGLASEERESPVFEQLNPTESFGRRRTEKHRAFRSSMENLRTGTMSR